MEIAIGILTILSIILAFKAQLQISITTPCQTNFNMFEKDDPANATIEDPGTIVMGDIAADTIDEMPKFFSSVATAVQENGKRYEGSIHLLSLQIKFEFALWPAGPAGEDLERFEDAWQLRSSGMQQMDMEDVVLVESAKSACTGGPQGETVRLSLKYVGASSAAVVLSG